MIEEAQSHEIRIRVGPAGIVAPDGFACTQADLDKVREASLKADKRQVGGNHYKSLPIQPWDVMESVLTEEEFIGFLKGNIIKYSMRNGHKVSDDVEKARHYQQKLLEIQNRD